MRRALKLHINKILRLSVVLLVLSLLPGAIVKAQDYFQLNQYIYSAHAINPAFSGIEDLVSANLGMRAQWASIADAPRTFYAGFNGSLSGMQNAFSEKRTLRTSVPRLYNKLEYEPGNTSHGLGFYVFNDKFGPFRDLSIYLTYAFILQITKKYKLSIGLSAEFANQRFNESDVSVYTPDQDLIYQQYAGSNGNVTDFNLNTGVLLYGNNLFVGYSIHHLVRLRLSVDNFTSAGENLIYHFLMAGINLPVGTEFTFQPSTLLKYNSANEFKIDLVGKIKYREIIWGGITYRHQDAIGLLLGFFIENRATVNYSYEFHTNDIRTYAGGSHELVVGFRIFNDKLSRPFLW